MRPAADTLAYAAALSVRTPIIAPSAASRIE
jgi:hypothetical protein